MFAITGITGRIGGMVARELLATGRGVRAVVRDPGKGAQLAPLGYQVALADLGDAIALQKAFTGVEAVFVLLPPNFDPSPGYPETRHLVSALRKALSRCDAERVLVLSTVGAQATQDSLLSQLALLEQELGGLPMPTTFLRPAWFMDNVAWDVELARTSGLMPSFLQPLDRPLPMVAALDVGRAGSRPRTLPLGSHPCLAAACVPRPCPEIHGRHCSVPRECGTQRRVCACWTASTKGGSASQAQPGRAPSTLPRCCGAWSKIVSRSGSRNPIVGAGRRGRQLVAMSNGSDSGLGAANSQPDRAGDRSVLGRAQTLPDLPWWLASPRACRACSSSPPGWAEA